MNDEIKLLEYQNPYWKNNHKKFNQLLDLVKQHPKRFQFQLRQTGMHNQKGKTFYIKSEDNRPLLNWINERLPQLANYHDATKCYWILNGIEDFQRCIECGNTILNDDNGMNSFQKKYCSKSCADRSPLKKQKRRLSCLKKYGVENPMQSCNVKNKVRQNNFDKYGVYTTLNLKKVRIANTLSLQRCEVKDKRKNTNLQKYGNSCSLHGKDVHEKTKNTWLNKYGVDNPNKSEVIKQKKKNTNILHRGVEYSFQSQQVREKIINSTLEHYGVEYPLQSNVVMTQLINTCLDRYGVINGGASKQAHEKMHKKYTYNNIQFDSAPEIALYIWLQDNNVDFEFQPNIVLSYMHKEEKHFYFPDFRIEGFLYEVKGNMFFKDHDPAKEMTCPYRNEKWSDERYQEECEKFEAKRRCMVKHQVKILTAEKYMFYVKYIEEKYGKSFLKSFKNSM